MTFKEIQNLVIVFVEFATKKTREYNVGQIIKDKHFEDDFKISYLRRKNDNKAFAYPDTPEIASLNLTNIKAILPIPKVSDAAKRQNLLSNSLLISEKSLSHTTPESVPVCPVIGAQRNIFLSHNH